MTICTSILTTAVKSFEDKNSLIVMYNLDYDDALWVIIVVPG
jgi:hypothetical protein